ncbi:hypothetical protein [Intestinimonas massiliensis (ex Afouda et al. 2020)]|nr:hypothetical protein [Intestinimonas massiliensis (ex Afouda et al. 2020)]
MRRLARTRSRTGPAQQRPNGKYASSDPAATSASRPSAHSWRAS